MKKRDKKRLLALALCLCLVAFGRPVPALASAGTDVSVAPDSAVTSTTPAASASGSGGESGKTPESAPSAPGVTITGFTALAPEVAKQSYEAGKLASQDNLVLPGTLEATGADGVPLPVTVSGWASNTPFDPDVAGVYTFAPTLDLSALPAGSGLGQGVEPPAVTVTLTEAANALALAPRAGTVTVNNWDELKNALNAREAEIEINSRNHFEAMGPLVVDYSVTIHNDGGGIARMSYTGVMFDVRDDGALTLKGDLVLDGRNVANADRLVTVAGGGSLTLNDGATLKNSTGGGAYVDGGTLTMRDSPIFGNTADEGGGVYLTGSTATFHMEGGRIYGNMANSVDGGGVHVSNGCTFTLTDGSIADNRAGMYGGGVMVSGGAFIMDGGSVTGNTAQTSGGGVEVYNGAFTMNGGSITGNTAKVARGGGVMVASGKTFTMKDGEVGDNTSSSINGVGVETANNGVFDHQGGRLFVTPADWAALKAAVEDAGAPTKPAATEVLIGGSFNAVDEGTAATGTIKVTRKLAIHSAAIPGAPFTITRDGGFTDAFFNVGSGGDLTLENVALDGNKGVVSAHDVLVAVVAGGKLTLGDGAVLKNNKISIGSGGGVDVYGTGSSFEMTGGSILGNTADMDGGGVHVGAKGQFTMAGGKIIGNTATRGGGVYVANGAKMDMSGTAQIGGGSGDANTATNGGGVYVTGADSKLDMTGGNILGNRASSLGGGMCVDGGATMKMSGAAQIGGGSGEGNTGGTTGGGVYLNGTGSQLTMAGGKILGNTGGKLGGGVYVDSGATMKMSGAAQIGGSGPGEGNTADNGAGVCVWGTDSKLDMQGGSILGNSTNVGTGGGVYVVDAGSRFDMTGGRILGNTASDGGGVTVSTDATMNMGGTAQIGGSGIDEGNEAFRNGGGVFVSGGTFHMMGGSITGNTAGSKGAAVCLYSSPQDVEIQGGLVAAQGGDTVYVDDTGVTFTVSGGAVMQTDANGNAIYSGGSGEDKVQIKDNGTVYSRGKAVVYDDPALTFPGPSGDGLVILQTDDNAPYKAGTDNDLSYTPAAATVEWNLDNGLEGIRYEKGSNTGFLPLGMAVKPADPPQPSGTTTITGLPNDYTLLVGQSVSWTPVPAGGVWSYDKDLLKMTQDGDTYTFTALKTGKATATYAVDGMPFTVTITINDSTIPQTGDTANLLPWLLIMLAALAGGENRLLVRCRQTGPS